MRRVILVALVVASLLLVLRFIDRRDRPPSNVAREDRTAPGPLPAIPDDTDSLAPPASPRTAPPASPSTPPPTSTWTPLPLGVAGTHIVEVPLPATAGPADVRAARIEFDPPLRDWAAEGEMPAGETRFRFFDDVERELVLTAHEAAGATLDGGVFTGEVAGAPGSYVVLAHVDDAVAGMMYVPGQGLYRVRTTRDGSVELTEMNADLVPPEAALPTEFPADALMPASADTTGAVAQADTGNTVIDLLVAYTPATATANGGTSGVNALAAAAVATTNLAYQNSLITITLRLVGTTQVAYTESHALATDLFRLASTSDGIMDSIFASRTSVKADLVSLMVTGASDAAGVAYLWTPGNVNFASVSFSVVVDIYADANLTLAHELGHNMGANHAAPEASGGAYSYSLGWRFTGSNGIQYRTVMAYAPGIRVPYFSNPSVSYLGAPTGTSTANNALTLMNSRTTVAAFQTGLTAADQAWTPVTAGDFNADGKTDLIWRNSATGKVIAWLMNGSTTTSTTTVWNSDPTWVPIAAADFNADGKPDLIWRNSSTGKVIVWLMSGTTMTSSVTLWTGDPTWVPITAGDFNGDSKPDLVWRNSATGKVIVWLMNGTTMTSTITLWTGDAAWIPVAASDLNADGKTDLIWRNTATGRVVAWLMDGTTQVSAPALWTGAATWVPYTAGAFNADASPDLVWRNSADGRVIIWFMSGTTMSSTTAIWQ